MLEKNLIGSGDNVCFGNSLLEHWKKYYNAGIRYQLWCSVDVFDFGYTLLASENVYEICG